MSNEADRKAAVDMVARLVPDVFSRPAIRKGGSQSPEITPLWRTESMVAAVAYAIDYGREQAAQSNRSGT
uniref:Uncharacterized protein n=1 Tax=viral metagenome TaxID=1070528 RepID=A0A6M3JKR2_9ZZZZ